MLYTGAVLDHFHVKYFILDKDNDSSGQGRAKGRTLRNSYKMLNCYENARTKKKLTGEQFKLCMSIQL